MFQPALLGFVSFNYSLEFTIPNNSYLVFVFHLIPVTCNCCQSCNRSCQVSPYEFNVNKCCSIHEKYMQFTVL